MQKTLEIHFSCLHTSLSDSLEICKVGNKKSSGHDRSRVVLRVSTKSTADITQAPLLITLPGDSPLCQPCSPCGLMSN